MFILIRRKLICITGDSARQITLCLMAMNAEHRLKTDRQRERRFHAWKIFERNKQTKSYLKSFERVFEFNSQSHYVSKAVCVQLPTHLKFPFCLFVSNDVYM